MTTVKTLRIAFAAMGAVSLAAAGALLALPVATPAAATDVSASAIVPSGTFSGLAIDVSQTVNLTNQVVRITWDNATATFPTVGTPAHSYLQVMQCWGDGSADSEPSATPGLAPDASPEAGYGPTAEQCQYGGIGTREIDRGSMNDPLNTLERNFDCATGPGSCRTTYMPFESVTGSDPVIDPAANYYFDANTTNELNAARTRSDGSGLAYFEVQTLRQAPGLGCGAALDSGSRIVGRSCWLVVVPRDDHEVNGSQVGQGQVNLELLSSPLSPTNWKNRIVIPLTFAPIGNVCPIGVAERRVLGTDVATDAMSRWQPTLCESGDRTFNYSQVSEVMVSNQLNATDPGLALVNVRVPDLEDTVYAPVLAGGLTFASLIERQVRGTETQDVLEAAGERMPALTLNARLVAKLITQSYRGATADPDNPDKTSHLALVDPVTGRVQVDGDGNLVLAPRSVIGDPEFLALNPSYASYPSSRMPISDAILPVGSSAANQLVWKWLLSDPDAKAFLEGTADDWGMKVNPYYRNSALTSGGDVRSDFPKRDEICRDPIAVIDPESGEPTYPEASILCSTGAHPYAADFETGARAAGRGDDLAIANWDPSAAPARFKANGPAAVGERAVLVLTTTALAERYGLAQAALVNSSGNAVAPTADSITDAVANSLPTTRTATPAPVFPDPAKATGSAYPLTTLTYAVTVPSKLSVIAAEDYAAFIEYATQSGQRLGVSDGRLPYGYAPLPNVLSVQAQSAAAAIVAAAVLAAEPTPTPTPTPTPSPSTSPSASPSPTVTTTPTPSDTGGGLPDPGTTDSGVLPPPVPSPSAGLPAPSLSPAPGATPATYLVASPSGGPSRLAVPLLAGLGVVGLAVGLLLPKFTSRH